MTEEEQKLYNVIADWWDDVFCAASYKGKDASLIDLVHAIMDLKYEAPEDADPYNLRGRLPMQPVWKQNGL
jgi:hypothetical protein